MVYVLAKNGSPLMPTENHGYVRILLKSHRAVVVRKNPFTIRLKFTTTTCTQPLVCGIDPGRTNIGVAVATEDGECVFSANADTCNKDVPKRIAERKAHRNIQKMLEISLSSKVLRNTKIQNASCLAPYFLFMEKKWFFKDVMEKERTGRRTTLNS